MHRNDFDRGKNRTEMLDGKNSNLHEQNGDGWKIL